MFETPFYHRNIRNLVVGFGTLFSHIKIVRDDEATPGNTQIISVPIAYGPKEKWNVRVDQDPNLENHTYVNIPRMGFEITGYAYDAARAMNRNNKINGCTTAGVPNGRVNAPVPYNVELSLYLLTKGTEDSLSVIEQILPLFAPEYTLSTVSPVGVPIDIPIILNGVSVSDDFEGDFQTRRLVTHTLSFTAKLNLFGAVDTSSGVILNTTVPVTSAPAATDTHLATGVLPSKAIVVDTWKLN